MISLEPSSKVRVVPSEIVTLPGRVTSPITFPDIPFIKTVFSMLPSKVSSPEVLIHESETDTVFFESTPLAPSAPDAFTILFVISTFSCEKTATSLVDMASARLSEMITPLLPRIAGQ